MCGYYWSQWDKSALDDWQDNHAAVPVEEDLDGDEAVVEPHDCGNCMECLGLSWEAFM